MTVPKSYIKGKQILAVDDEEDILETIADVLEEAHVDRAGDYATASRKIKEKRYDLAVLDIMGVNGLQLLQEAVPTLSRVAVLLYPDYPVTPAFLREAQAAAQALGLTLQSYDVRDPKEFEGAFAAMTKARTDGLLVQVHPIVFAHPKRVAELAAQSRLPAVYPYRDLVVAGGLMAYEANIAAMFRRAPAYVDKILKGANAGDLPVDQPTKFDLVINLKTAKALGLTIPQTLLMRADEVIE